MISLWNRFYVCHELRPLSCLSGLLQKIFLVEKSDYCIIELLWLIDHQEVAHTFPHLKLQIRREATKKLFRISRPKRRLRKNGKDRHVDLISGIESLVVHT